MIKNKILKFKDFLVVNFQKIKNSKEELKRLSKPFLFIFLVSFLVINWSDISWAFNYKITSQILIKSLPQIKFSPAFGFFDKIFAENIQKEKKEIKRPANPGNLEIPRFGVLVPLIFIDSENEKELYGALEKGTVHFTDSALPGQIGQTIILGHSSPANWPKINYDWAFSKINELNEGDEVILYVENQKYVYSVKRKFFLDRGEQIPEDDLTKKENVLILVSCWPPGKDVKRIAVEAELKIF
ncbi:MAG: sortase [Candidatus Nealsonbacteria bacterium]|nr:sortase [Candidatus Nealsonbacteria bacterium]